MDFKTSRDNFLKLLDSIDPVQVQPFLDWVKESFSTTNQNRDWPTAADTSEADLTLLQIVQDLKQCVPTTNGVLDSEKLVWPTNGAVADCKPENTLHVDSFLFDDDDIDELTKDENSPISRYYCKECGSRRIAPLTFVSHSSSQNQLKFIFRELFPSLHGKIVLDIGSRLGGILYAAFLYTDASKIIGVELNPDFCQLQNDIVQKYNMQRRVQIVCDDIRNKPDIVGQADVVVLFNSFQFFMNPDEEKACFEFLRACIKPKAVLITHPSLKILTNHLAPLDFDIDQWVTQIEVDENVKRKFLQSTMDDADSIDQDLLEELNSIYVYQVK